MKRVKTGVFWFTHDMRLHDNPALMQAKLLVDELVCVYVKDYAWQTSSLYQQPHVSASPQRFLDESLGDLASNLAKIGQRLIVLESEATVALSRLLRDVGATAVFRSETAGWYENRAWEELKKNKNINFHSVDTQTLFTTNTLPFSLSNLPASFTQFKNAVSKIEPSKCIPKIGYLPPPPLLDYPAFEGHEYKSGSSVFRGGERSGLAHLADYFSSDKPLSYKDVRNAIDGWDNSCKFSPWLANGCVSVRQVVATLSDYENNNEANDSTYWIYFELLWREYFHWYALKNGPKLFSFAGIKSRRPLTCFYPERFQKWTNGTTPYPLVNACMKELRETGYLSNRGRQIVASCLVNELAIDWRYGAAYFEQALIDYDVASNWGNWQYLAGVGADTRDKRHFNLEKQTQQFDPDSRYIRLWGGDKGGQALDSVDAADWPIA